MGRLERIRELEADLSAKIQIGEGEPETKEVVDGWHWEDREVWAANRGVGTESVKVEDTHYETFRPGIYAPDVNKIQNAAEELVKIYAESHWYNFRIRKAVKRALGPGFVLFLLGGRDYEDDKKGGGGSDNRGQLGVYGGWSR